MKPRATVVIGASAGGVEALTAILPALPQAIGAAIVVVVHMGPEDPGLLPTLFSSRCTARVKEAEDKEPLCSGVIYFAPVNYHLLVERDLTFSLSCDEPVHYSRPSIDILFESVAAADSVPLLAVVLSGANADGASGANAIVRHGGTVFVQTPETALCKTMPNAAIERCPDAAVIPLAEMAAHLLRWVAESGSDKC